MHMTRVFYGWKFALTIALPLMVATLGVALLTFDLLGRVSTGANVEDHQRTQQIVKSALNAAQQHLANVTDDNTFWDDAAHGVYGDIDEDWLYSTWGVATGEGVNYDGVLGVNRDKPDVIFGYLKGKKFSPVANQYLSGKLDSLLDRLPKDTKTYDTKSAILNTSDGLAIVAAAPVLPTSEDIVVPVARPYYMIFIKFLTPEYVAAIGEQYVIQDMKMAAFNSADSGGEIIKDFTGAPVASVQWIDRRPGDVAGATVRPEALAVIGFLALVMLGIGFRCWQLIHTVGKAVKAETEARESTALFIDLNHQVTLLNMELEGKVHQLNDVQEEIVRKGKMAQLGQLTATVAHELRNPLSVVRTAAYMVRRKTEAAGFDLGQSLTHIDSGISRCDNIISQLLDFSRLSVPDLKLIEVDQWLVEAVEEEAKGLPSIVEIRCILGLGDLKAALDANRMRCVIINILTNATEAMVGKDGSRVATQTASPMIQVSTRLQPRGIEIVITDNGPGMSEEFLTRIREPLFTTKSFGTGLGIPAVEQILEFHGGGLDIWSTPGNGARFIAWFPAERRESKAA